MANLTIDIYVHSADVEAKLDTIISAVKHVVELQTTEVQLMTQLEDDMNALEAKVTAIGDVVTSAETLLAGLSQQLKDAIAAGGNTAALTARIEAVTASLDAKSAELAAAVAANTPAAP